LSGTAGDIKGKPAMYVVKKGKQHMVIVYLPVTAVSSVPNKKPPELM
jgi:hypothetical protein